MEKNQVWSAIVYSGWLSSRGLRGYFICFNMNERPAGKFSPFSFGWLLDLTFISLVGKRQRALSHIDLNITFCKERTKGSCLKAQKRMIFVFFSNDEEANVKEEVFLFNRLNDNVLILIPITFANFKKLVMFLLLILVSSVVCLI